MKGWISAFALYSVLGLPGVAPLDAMAEPAKIADESEALEEWRVRVIDARDRVRDARAELVAAEFDYANWRQRKQPRGTPKGQVIARIDAAEREVEAAESALPDVVDEARRAGLLPGDFRALDIEP